MRTSAHEVVRNISCCVGIESLRLNRPPFEVRGKVILKRFSSLVGRFILRTDSPPLLMPETDEGSVYSSLKVLKPAKWIRL